MTHDQRILLAYANEIRVQGLMCAMRVGTGYTKEAHQWDEHYTTHDKHMGLSGHNTV